MTLREAFKRVVDWFNTPVTACSVTVDLDEDILERVKNKSLDEARLLCKDEIEKFGIEFNRTLNRGPFTDIELINKRLDPLEEQVKKIVDILTNGRPESITKEDIKLHSTGPVDTQQLTDEYEKI